VIALPSAGVRRALKSRAGAIFAGAGDVGKNCADDQAMSRDLDAQIIDRRKREIFA
jgi:hypothetical protein